MLRRPLLSILAEVYKFARKEEVGKPTLQMRTELMAVVCYRSVALWEYSTQIWRTLYSDGRVE